MRKDEFNYALLACVFVSALVVSNLLATKVLRIGPFEAPAAVVAYPVTFLMTDVIGEIWGKGHAQRVVYIGILCQIITLAMALCAIYLPPAPYMTEFDEEYRNVLGSTARVVCASLLGFIASQTCDVLIFHGIRDRSLKHKWIRNNVSTMCSQVVDSSIFITIAFFGTGMDLVSMAIGQIALKWIIALADTPVFYALTKNNRQGTS
ncbi:MAG: queuosine precursor transporter [archaeon]|nr:queuosine precursor transporter [archaeon]